MDIERASEHDLIEAASVAPKPKLAEAKHRVAAALWTENYASDPGRLSALAFRFRLAQRRREREGRLAQLIAQAKGRYRW
jgi:hypothetical protein